MPPVDRNNPKRAASSDSAFSLMEFMRSFPDDAACLEWLWLTRYSADGKHAYCPKCQRERVFMRYATKQQRQSWSCTACSHKVHPTAETIFHKSSTSLHLWFYAMYLMASTRCGISAKQLERELGVTYKTAWRMFHLIRNQVMTQDTEPLEGKVEADETYVGGRPRLRDMPRRPDGSVRRGKSDKAAQRTTVVGAVERGGRVHATALPQGDQGGIARHVEEFVVSSAVLYTDEYVGYNRVGQTFKEHHRIRHAARVYVSGDVHTQTIEGFWSLVKRGLSGTHHSVSGKYLQGYLNEYAWRYNNRHEQDGAQFLRLLLRAGSVPTV